MYYWNQPNFEGLLAVATAAEARGLNKLAEYCRRRESGLRSQALNSLHEFIANVRAMDRDTRRDAVAWLAQMIVDNPEVHHLRVAPLFQEVVAPVLGEWTRQSAQLLPRRLLALLRGDISQLREVLEVDPLDGQCRAALIGLLLRAVEYSSHHLVEGTFIGAEQQAEADLEEVQRHIAQLPADTAREHAQRTHDELSLLLRDWAEFRAQGSGSFREWCGERGHDHRWPVIVYYGGSDRGAAQPDETNER